MRMIVYVKKRIKKMSLHDFAPVRHPNGDVHVRSDVELKAYFLYLAGYGGNRTLMKS